MFGLEFDTCAFGLQDKDGEFEEKSMSPRGRVQTNMLSLATVSRLCRGVAKTHVHTVEPRRADGGDILECPNCMKRFVNGTVETRLLRGMKRASAKSSLVAIDNLGRKGVFADSRCRSTKVGDGDEIGNRMAFSIPLTLSNSESDSEIEPRPDGSGPPIPQGTEQRPLGLGCKRPL